MKFSIGDPVFVKSNDEEGIIEEFIGKDMASIRAGENNYYVYLEDLEHPYLRWFTEKNNSKSKSKTYIDQIIPEKIKARESGLPTGCHLVFMPIYVFDEFDEKVTKLKLFIYNETPADYEVEYQVRSKSISLFQLNFEIINNFEFYLHNIDFEEMASNPTFTFRFIDKLRKSHDQTFNLQVKPKKLFEHIDRIKFDNQAFFHLPIFDELSAKPKLEIKVSSPRSNLKQVTGSLSHFDFQHVFTKKHYEIDLHIEKLSAEWQQLSPSEMLYIQLKACQEALDLAHATHQKMLILIHGIGKGRLKDEIHLLLNQTNYIKRYVYEYDPKYGYGSTKVYFTD
jgi:hypothetical protein